MKLIYCLLPILSIVATAAPAFAVAQGKIFKDPLGAIYIYGLMAGESVISVGPYAPAKIVQSDDCGLVRVTPLKSKPNGRIKFEGTTIDPSTLPTQPAPRCVNGVLEEPRPTNFKTMLGLIVIKAPQFNTRYQMQWLDRPALRSQKANKCGYVKFPAGVFGDNPILPTVDKKVATFKFSDLPQFPGLYCRNSTAQMWIPEGFPPQIVKAIDDAKPIEEFIGYDVPPPLATNTPPSVTFPADLVAVTAGSTVTVPVTLSDADTSLNSLTLQAVAFGGQPFPSELNVSFSGTGANRIATIQTQANSNGFKTFLIRASDGKATGERGITINITPPVVSNPIACRIGNSVRISDLPQLNRNYQLQTPSWNFGIRNSGTTRTATFANTGFTTQAFTTFGTFTLRDLITSQTITTFQASTLAFCP
jgi:hypothetical protein